METGKSNKKIMSDMIVPKKTTSQIKEKVLVVEKKAILPPQPIIIIPDTEEVEEESEVVYDAPRVPRVPDDKKRSGCMVWVLLVVGILAIAFAIGGLFAHANIAVVPKKITGEVDTTITMSQTNTPGVLFFATATKTFTNEEVIPTVNFSDREAAAKGIVRLYNTAALAKTIPTGTVVISSKGQKYTTDKKVVIPAQKVKVPGQIEVGVTAVSAGSEFNINQDDLTFEKADINKGVVARTVGAITGGTKGQEAVVDAQKISEVSEMLREKTKDISVLIARITQEIPDDMIALPITAVGTGPIITTEANHSDGLHVVAKNTITIVLVRKAELAQILAKKVEDGLEMPMTMNNLDGLTILSSTTIIDQEVPSILQMRVTGTATIVGDVDLSEIKTNIVGSPKSQAKDYLKENPAIASFSLRMVPFWRQVLPGSIDDISIKIQ